MIGRVLSQLPHWVVTKAGELMSEPSLKSIETKLDALLDQYQRLRQENNLLKAERSAWQSERAKLIKQNELARDRVEAMIERLKALEQSG